MAVLVVISFVGNSICMKLVLGWQGATVATLIPCLVTLGYVIVTRDKLIGSLMIFGLVAGFAELPTDAYDVLGSKTLVYPAGEPLLWTSPAYMPFAWMMSLTELGFLAWWLTHRIGLGWAMVVLTVVGGTYIPGFELMAKYGNFWAYRDCPMLFDAAPYYVILAEALIGASLPLVVRAVDRSRWPCWIALGIAEAAWIFAATWIATLLTV